MKNSPDGEAIDEGDENESVAMADASEVTADNTVTTEPVPSDDKTVVVEPSASINVERSSPRELVEIDTANTTVLREPEREVTSSKETQDENAVDAMDSSEAGKIDQTSVSLERKSSTDGVELVSETETETETETVEETSDKENVFVTTDSDESETVSKKLKSPNVTFMESLKDIHYKEDPPKTPVQQTRNNRRTMSATCEGFTKPTNDLPLSVKKSGRKRRRSEHSHPYSVKSPEEW